MRVSLLALLATGALAAPAMAEMNFNRIASFPVLLNAPDAEETSAEIIDATADGLTLVYSDSPAGQIGMIDITDPANPQPKGALKLDGEPTSVAIIGSTAYVGLNTSDSYTAPSGQILSIDVATQAITGSCDIGGQPDSVAKAKDGSFLAIAIENERDESLNDGEIPQMPAGTLAMVDLTDGALDCATLRFADLTGLADVAPSDPEPEYVSINGLGETVVSLQENNHLAVVARDGTVLSHFSAGAVDLTDIDATDERAALVFTESQPGRLREPDTVAWIDDNHFITANEGDYKGGSRSWSIFHKDGTLVYDSNTSFEHALVQIGHYPDKRSDAKGVEPELAGFGIFNGTPMGFVGAERASVVGVYDLTDPTAPRLHQLLPSGISPEGMVAIPDRNLLITANEFDGRADNSAPAHVMIYEYQDAPASYPHLTSAGMDTLTGWGALSGLVADGDYIWAVNDSFYGYQPRIFKIDPSTKPARIVQALDVVRANGQPAQKLDIEGITLDGKGGFWLASEGRTDRVVPHAIYNVNAKGQIKAEIPLPAELLAVEIRYGLEGITRVDNHLWMALQREWRDDPKGMVKLIRYDLDSKEWTGVHYPLETPETGWVGLSEITAHDGYLYILERDNQIAGGVRTKQVTRVALEGLNPAPLGSALPVVTKELVRDLVPDLTATGGYAVDKVEGLAIMADGTFWAVTDNDGVDDSSGETLFWSFTR